MHSVLLYKYLGGKLKAFFIEVKYNSWIIDCFKHFWFEIKMHELSQGYFCL